MIKEIPFSVLKGMTLASVDGEAGGDQIDFVTVDGRRFRLYHKQDCCENVHVESIVGDLQDLIGAPILFAEESASADAPDDACQDDSAYDSVTWTFYKLATRKGWVDIRWFGTSNGYYSEAVDFEEVVV